MDGGMLVSTFKSVSVGFLNKFSEFKTVIFVLSHGNKELQDSFPHTYMYAYCTLYSEKREG